jgi:hypothetical protein
MNVICNTHINHFCLKLGVFSFSLRLPLKGQRTKRRQIYVGNPIPRLFGFTGTLAPEKPCFMLKNEANFDGLCKFLRGGRGSRVQCIKIDKTLLLLQTYTTQQITAVYCILKNFNSPQKVLCSQMPLFIFFAY